MILLNDFDFNKHNTDLNNSIESQLDILCSIKNRQHKLKNIYAMNLARRVGFYIGRSVLWLDSGVATKTTITTIKAYPNNHHNGFVFRLALFDTENHEFSNSSRLIDHEHYSDRVILLDEFGTQTSTINDVYINNYITLTMHLDEGQQIAFLNAIGIDKSIINVLSYTFGDTIDKVVDYPELDAILNQTLLRRDTTVMLKSLMYGEEDK